MQAKDDKLTGLLLASNARSLDDELLDLEADRAGFDDFVHKLDPRWHWGISQK
jgi:hypothetical protein